LASTKKTVTEPQTIEIDESVQPQTNISEESSPLSDGANETENNKLQRLLTIMELLGKLVEKDALTGQNQGQPEPARSASPNSGENTRDIVTTIAGLLVEATDLEAIKERISLDNPQAVELLGQLGEILKIENKPSKKRGKTGEAGKTKRVGETKQPLYKAWRDEDTGQSEPNLANQPTGKDEPLQSLSPDQGEISIIEKRTKNGTRKTRTHTGKAATAHQLILDIEPGQDGAPAEKVKTGPAETEEEWINILSSAFYHATREALSLNTFVKSDGSPWPTAPLNRGGASGLAQLVPPLIQDEPLMPAEDVDRWVEIMWKQREELSDLDADALDMLCHIWLEQAIKPEDSAVAEIDRFLEMRGLQKKKSGNNRRGGFTPEQRREILRALSHIQSIWLKLGQIEVFEDRDEEDSFRNKKKRQSVTKAFESRAFVVTDRMGQLKMDGYMDVERFIYQPGKLFAQFLFGPGRQTAILSAKAIQYDRYRQKWEKRLARYFSWQWRIQAAKGDYTRPYRVNTLLKAVGENVDERHPNTTRDRLEKALDRLQTDKVLASWQYDRWEEKVTEQRGWVEHWLQATVLLEPPESIRQTYNSLERTNLEATHRSPRLQTPVIEVDETLQLVRDLRNKRLETGMSQTVCAEQLGIAQGVLSRLEKNKLKPSVQLQLRIRKWLKTLE